ncbi:MAG: hypothetical protein KGH69_01550 [Candidatus Micrarchaeota archaeon]|nr:hypothetical protein [Candidatus Micrarchaeota archaeon]
MIIVDDYKNAINSMLHPSAGTKNKMKVGEAIIHFWKASAIPFVLWVLTSMVLGSAVGGLFGTAATGLGPVLGGLLAGGITFLIILFYIILMPVSIIINAAWIHLFGKFLLRFFKNDYAATATAVSYSTTAAMSFIWVPFIGSLIALWAVVVEVLALANQQGISWVKSLGVLIACVVIPIAVVLVAAFAIGFALG